MKTATKITLNDTHLRRMVDDTGILRQAIYDLPDPAGGYTTDDNARLMMMSAMYYEATGDPKHLDTCYRALSFLQYACVDGWFRCRMGFDRRFREEAASQDCFGRCIWCLGYITSRPALPEGLRGAAGALLEQAAPHADRLTQLRACAYTCLGVALWNREGLRGMLAEHLARVATHYHENAVPGWFWYESEITVCNATIPHALLAGYQVIGGDRLLSIGLRSFDFLLEATTRDGFFWPVGCHGWSMGESNPSLYNQQPVEACGTLLCCLKAHRITSDKRYLEKAELCLDWFLGYNSHGAQMINPVSGGCCDGLTEDGPDRNQGAESLLSWYVSALAMEAYRKQSGTGDDGRGS
ncbi:glycosyltransferase [Ruminococcaceae bacterium OttesenSCG-928-D13]|nr:glycosyltransferase [Ruminococcaceae bacterium OttesenSCG-928-D13]